jgi:hypothetical protein
MNMPTLASSRVVLPLHCPPFAAADGVSHLKLGYYVVCNPSQERLLEGITFEQAREAEMKYFASNAHWAEAARQSPAAVGKRLGTRNLRAGLSALLVEGIEQQMPEMRQRARAKLAEIAASLKALPPPPGSDPAEELRGLLWAAAEALQRHVHATVAGDKSFYKSVLQIYRKYGERVILSTPAFLVGRTLVSALSKSEKTMINKPVLAEGGHAPAGAPGGVEMLLPLEALSEGDIDLSTYKSEQEAASVLMEDEHLRGALRAAFFPERFTTLEDVSALLQRQLGRELTGFIPYSAVEELIRSHQGQWRAHAEACLEEVAAVTREQAEAVVSEHFRRFPLALRAVV